MLKIDIPGRDALRLENLLLDYNGTIARDGHLLPELLKRLQELQEKLNVLVLTADTYGTVRAEVEPWGLQVETFPQAEAAAAKAAVLRGLNGQTVCLGNGYNDCEMCAAADLAIGVLEAEGLAAALVAHCDVISRSAAEALDLLVYPDRLRATLRT